MSVNVNLIVLRNSVQNNYILVSWVTEAFLVLLYKMKTTNPECHSY